MPNWQAREKQHTFPARIPAAPYCIAFSADADKPEERTATISEKTRLASYYFYSTPEQLLTAWLKDFSAGRDSAWYWIYAEGRCICS